MKHVIEPNSDVWTESGMIGVRIAATTIGVTPTMLWLWASCCRTTAVTGPPLENYDFTTRVIGGSR
jgi:hypothetical protein